MKKYFITTITTFIICTAWFNSVVFAQVESVEFLTRWASSERYTLEVLDKMPESGIQFKVDSSAMSFGEQIAHIGKTITMLSKNFLNAPSFIFQIDPANATKEQLKAYIIACYRYSVESIDQLSPEDLEEIIPVMGSEVNRRQVMALMMDHTSHHRGSAVVYLRIYGIDPPTFVRF
jgi:uncharacterized damage-inducible protein DinB